MPGRMEFSGSLEQQGTKAQFSNGMLITGSLNANTLTISGTFFGDGSSLTGIPQSSATTDLFFGSASADGVVQGPWVTTGTGENNITLTVSSSTPYNHFTILKDNGSEWVEVSNYGASANGLSTVKTLDQQLTTGIYRYLLLAVSTSSLKTRVKFTTVVINQNEL